MQEVGGRTVGIKRIR